MQAGAFINLHGGPLDGLTIKWPNSASDFPVVIDFGFMLPDEDGVNLTTPQTVRYHRYSGVGSCAVGPVLADGMPAHEHATYMHQGVRSETGPSIAELWNKTDPAPEKRIRDDGDLGDALRELDEEIGE